MVCKPSSKIKKQFLFSNESKTEMGIFGFEPELEKKTDLVRPTWFEVRFKKGTSFFY
jgi:hypothetical protein